MSRKIILPEFESFEDAYDSTKNTVKSRDYFCSWSAIIDDEYNYIYGYISPTCYYDDAIVKTEDFGIKKRSKENLERVYNKVVKQLCDRYKKWVDGLYIQESSKKEINDGSKERRIDLDKVC